MIMDLKTIKKNLASQLRTTRYRVGVDGFMSYASENLTPDDKLRCPCSKCVNNNKRLSVDDVNYHLLQFGMMSNYSVWTFHGEIVIQTSTPTASEPVCQNETMVTMDVEQLVHDAFGYRRDDPNSSYSAPHADEHMHGPDIDAQNFYNLLKDADQELWPGCELSKLSFLVLLFHIKSINKWTNKSFNDLLGILLLAIPKSANIPKSFKEAKKIIEKLGLNYIKIHSCPNHCQLFWKDKANDDICSICGTSRWKRVREKTTSTGRIKKKGVPAKVLRYFPLKPRLKRLFMSKYTASLMRWHDEEHTKNEKMLSHPADSEAWKDFDARRRGTT